MPIISLPYEYKNGVATSGNITIDTTNYPLCGQKYFELRPLRVLNIGTDLCIYYQYQGDEYGTDSLSIDDFFDKINQAYVCPDDCNCNLQEAGFDYELTALRAVDWSSSAIVEAVGSGNKVYSISTLTVDGVSYATATIWDDSTKPTRASDTPKDYIDEIISYIEGLSIPSYKGAFNRAVNDASDNHLGTDLLSLYFGTAILVDIKITISGVVTGSFIEVADTTIALSLELTDTSTLNPSDSISDRVWSVTDGQNNLVYKTTSPALLSVWTIQGCSNLNPNNNWVLTEVIETENECYVDNVSTGIIESGDINTCITAGTPITGNGN